MRNIFTIVIFYLLCFILLKYINYSQFIDYENIKLMIDDNETYVIIIFIISMTLGSILFFPISMPGLLAAGIIWGAYKGCIISTISTSCAAAISFTISKYFRNSSIVRVLYSKLGNFIQNIPLKHQVKYLSFAIINPVLPQSLINYSFGFSNLSFSQFIITTTIVSTPMNFIYTLLGKSLNSLTLNEDLTRGIYYLGISITIIIATSLYFDYKKYAQSNNK